MIKKRTIELIVASTVTGGAALIGLFLVIIVIVTCWYCRRTTNLEQQNRENTARLEQRNKDLRQKQKFKNTRLGDQVDHLERADHGKELTHIIQKMKSILNTEDDSGNEVQVDSVYVKRIKQELSGILKKLEAMKESQDSEKPYEVSGV